MARPDPPIEVFRQLTGAATRAIARKPGLTVAFSPEPSGVHGSEVRLPVPSRDLPAREVTALRGVAIRGAQPQSHNADAPPAHPRRRWRAGVRRGRARSAMPGLAAHAGVSPKSRGNRIARAPKKAYDQSPSATRPSRRGDPLRARGLPATRRARTRAQVDAFRRGSTPRDARSPGALQLSRIRNRSGAGAPAHQGPPYRGSRGSNAARRAAAIVPRTTTRAGQGDSEGDDQRTRPTPAMEPMEAESGEDAKAR